MAKRVFVSFDFDNDLALKEFIIQQAKRSDSPFSIVNTSLKEAAPQNTWVQKATRAIRGSDLVIVMVGRYTHRAPGVLKEIAIARQAGVRIIQVIGYRDGNYKPVPDGGRLYSWNWDNLKRQIGS